MIILDLDIGETIENAPERGINDFSLLLDLCFDISDYFTMTIHNWRKISASDILDEESNKIYQELQPYFLKKIEVFDWGIYGRMYPSADVYIFKCEDKAKAVLQKYFDDFYLNMTVLIPKLSRYPHKTNSMFEDLCFFKQNDMILATISHESMCVVYLQNEEIKNKFYEICEWNECKGYVNVSEYPVKDILSEANYKSHPLYLFLNCIRREVTYHIKKKSLEHLYCYVKGYCDREINTDDQYMNNMLMIIDDFFPEFVRTYYGETQQETAYPRKHWSEIITEKSISQEEAFDKFYELLGEFLDKNWGRYEIEFNF